MKRSIRSEAQDGSGTRANVAARSQAVSSLPREEKDGLAQSLRRYFRDRSPSVRGEALRVVCEENLREVEPQVIALLSDPSRWVRLCAAECMGFLHKGQNIRVVSLYPLLNDPYFLVRIETLESLAQIGDRSSLARIAKRLRDDDALVRAYAAQSIADLGGREYAARIVGVRRTEQDERAKAGMTGALFRLGDRDEFPALLDFLSSPQHHTRCATAQTLLELALDEAQLRAALHGVRHAGKNFLFPADKTTMESIAKLLRKRQAVANLGKLRIR